MDRCGWRWKWKCGWGEWRGRGEVWNSKGCTGRVLMKILCNLIDHEKANEIIVDLWILEDGKNYTITSTCVRNLKILA